MSLGLVKRNYQKLYTFTIRAKSYIASRLIRLKVRKISFSDTIEGKVMILVPHSDDEWVGCSRIVTSEKSAILIANMDMNGGDTEDIHSLRRQELLSIVDRYGLDSILISSNKAESLSTLIKDFKPDYICVPFYYDWHPEHLETRKILYNALRLKLPDCVSVFDTRLNIIEYQVSVPIPAQCVTHCKKMTRKEQSNKWDIFRETYKTQAFFPIWRFKYNEYISGRLCGDYACENYVCSSVDQWVSTFADNIISEQQRIKIMSDFRGITRIRTTIASFEQQKLHYAKENK